MKLLFALTTILAVNLLSVRYIKADVNGGTNCAACSLIIGLIEQLAQVHSTDVITAASKYICGNLEKPLNETCAKLLEEYGEALIDGIYHKQTPDIICLDIGLCTQDPGREVCHLFPLPPNYPTATVDLKRPHSHTEKVKPDVMDNSICTLPGIKEICERIDNFADGHLPLQDADQDKFGTEPTLRGTHWRGKDCNDLRKDFYPGRKPIEHDRKEDSNCNGIYGVDPNGKPYEDLYCSESEQRGILLLGDSAGAHFHIPPEIFMAEKLSKDTFANLLMMLTDELDWPQLSATTAFTENLWPESIEGPVDSLYMRQLNNNLCMHRDYQNIGVNGARSGSMNDIVKGLARDKTTDYPLIVMLALIGNDVCNGHEDTVAHMTTETEYRTNMLTTLQYLNETLPNKSIVIISGLADGGILWKTLNSRLHPIGQLNGDVTYTDLYDYLNCLQVSPCTGWMSSNSTIRDITSQRAQNLSLIAKDIALNKKFSTFDMLYMDYNIEEVMHKWEAAGGEDWEVIEPVDGFHPGQIAQALMADYMYQEISKKIPSVVKKNPHNQKITELFGDQGGY